MHPRGCSSAQGPVPQRCVWTQEKSIDVVWSRDTSSRRAFSPKWVPRGIRLLKRSAIGHKRSLLLNRSNDCFRFGMGLSLRDA